MGLKFEKLVDSEIFRDIKIRRAAAGHNLHEIGVGDVLHGGKKRRQTGFSERGRHGENSGIAAELFQRAGHVGKRLENGGLYENRGSGAHGERKRVARPAVDFHDFFAYFV